MPELLDVVELTQALPEQGLAARQSGTVVELLAPDAWLVEFADERGVTLAVVPLRQDQLRGLA